MAFFPIPSYNPSIFPNHPTLFLRNNQLVPVGVVQVPVLDLDETFESDKDADTGGVLPAPSCDYEPALIVMNPDTGTLSNCYFRTPEDFENLREFVIQHA